MSLQSRSSSSARRSRRRRYPWRRRPPRAVRPNQKWTKNFSDKEDEMLVLAWLNVSSDGPAHGGERAPYWKRMHDYFHARRDFESERSENSLLHRWSTIQDSVKRFDRCVADVVDGQDDNSLTPQDTVTLLDLSWCSWLSHFFSLSCALCSQSGMLV